MNAIVVASGKRRDRDLVCNGASAGVRRDVGAMVRVSTDSVQP
jgi:hypothetical protein